MDNSATRGPADRTRINISQDYEVKYWTSKFGITVEQLQEAVSEAGSSSTEKIRQALVSLGYIKQTIT